MSDLSRAFDTLNAKTIPYTTLFNYADGAQPLQYSTTRLHEIFRDLNTHFQENWCAVVVGSVYDRLNLQGWDTDDATRNAALDDLWNRLQVSLEADEVHEDALITTEGYLIVWRDGDTLEVYRNDPRMVHVFYDRERPKVKRYAAKWWNDDKGWYLNLYYPDKIEKYYANSKDRPSTANAFQLLESPVNPFGAIPVFHFRCKGELGLKVTTLQDAVNKLLADMMIAAEFGAFKQRWVIAQGDPGALKNAPNENWWVPAGDGQGQQTSVGQFDATPLENYTRPMDRFANSIAIISRTPKHYFFSQTGDPSGEALIAMEAPLTKKAEKYHERFGVVWQEVAAFLLKLSGAGDVEQADVRPVWKPSQSVQPYTEAQTRQLAIAAGIPLVTELKREGWSEDEIKAMQKDKQDEAKANAKMAPLLLDQARNETAQQNDDENNEE